MSVKTVPGALDILNQKLGGNAGDIPASSTKEYALEKIYKQLGGTESLDGVNTTAEIIEKIAGVAQGGGGSSDFSTAEVTLNFPFEGRVTSTTQVAQFLSMGGEITGAICNELTIKGPGSATHYLILYKENLIGELSFDENVTVSVVSGNAEVEEERYVHIHGNCELLINRPQ